MHKFVHFGCWNQGGCDMNSSKPNALTKNMKKLASNLAKQPADFVVVAGDNYYPPKNKDKKAGGEEKEKKDKPEKLKLPKVMSIAELTSGFDCLPSGVPVDIILGNHDLESGLLVKENDLAKEDDCTITTTEMTISANSNGKKDLVLYKKREFADDTLVLMIDTSMYEEEINSALKCYKKILNSENLTPEQLYSYQTTFIHDSLNNNSISNVKNIIIIGHHPIAGFKIKTDDSGNTTQKNMYVSHLFLETLYSIYQQKPSANLFYLCADLHCYQEGDITISKEGSPDMKVKQYIVGTGGTKLDDNPFTSSITILTDYTYANDTFSVNYTMSEDQISASKIESHGFLECFNNDGVMSFSFVSSSDLPNPPSTTDIVLPPLPPSTTDIVLPPLPPSYGGKKRTRKTSKKQRQRRSRKASRRRF